RRGALVRQLKKLVEHGETIALPAVLGDEDPGAFADIRRQVGSPLFEIPVPPPSVPGMRLNDELIRHAKRERVEIILGSKVTGADATDGHLDAAVVGTSGHDTHLKARTFLLAAGGFESGTLELDSYQKLSETILGLPLAVPAGELINDTWAGQQPLFRAGVATNDDMVVVDPATGQPVHDNLWAAGGVLAGAQRWDEKTGDGIAVASAVRAADAIISNLAGGQR
ncbi:glycerol-3-phosphate dehydrogenase subunit GlpB, partial [Propionibacterium freudenreichii]|nr:glycerol-3-phosphate dehydrogenase subunit GlpB [Propionibacterium freudenreichii]